jgi:TPP-dependent 2-oxoacid decarboxylase
VGSRPTPSPRNPHFDTGAFTARLDSGKTIHIRHHRTDVGGQVFPNVEMKDILAKLTRRITKDSGSPPVKPASLGPVGGGGRDPIMAETLYPRWANFLKPNDLLFAETGRSTAFPKPWTSKTFSFILTESWPPSRGRCTLPANWESE